FDARGMLDPAAQWDADPALRGTGTLTLIAPGGHRLDLFADRAIRSGAIAAYRELRDVTLVEAQAQLDELAHALALAVSTRAVEGAAVTSGPQSGFDLDLSALAAGNAVTLTYADIGSGETRTVRFVRVDDPSVLPLPGTATPEPGDIVHGIDFSGGVAAAIAQIGTALGADFAVSDQGGTVRIMDAAGAVRVDAL